jgi:hypothetical protein
VPRWGISVAVAALLLSSACGDDGSAVAADDDAAGTGLTAEEVAFCDEWTAAMTSGDEAVFDAALADSPPDLEQAAGLVLGADAEESASPEVAAAADEILNWIELHCFGGDAAVVEHTSHLR